MIDQEAGRLIEISLMDLKKQDKTAQKEVVDKQKEINQTIKTVKKDGLLPKNVSDRYDKRFGKKDEKKAFFNLFFIFVFCFIVTFFLQPSIFFLNNGTQLALSNYSGREVKHVEVYKLLDLFGSIGGEKANPLFTVDQLESGTGINIQTQKSEVLLAFADRQLPSIGITINPSAQGINTSSGNDNNGDLFYGGLKQQLGK